MCWKSILPLPFHYHHPHEILEQCFSWLVWLHLYSPQSTLVTSATVTFTEHHFYHEIFQLQFLFRLFSLYLPRFHFNYRIWITFLPNIPVNPTSSYLSQDHALLIHVPLSYLESLPSLIPFFLLWIISSNYAYSASSMIAFPTFMAFTDFTFFEVLYHFQSHTIGCNMQLYTILYCVQWV